jgi:hypothetical protein
MPSGQAKWTVLVWIAGDNNLDSFGVSDLNEMKKAGSTDDVAIAAQFDRAGNTGTRRYHLQKGTALEDDVVEELGETNTGDPQVAIDFFTWGMTRWPSDRVLAVLWNHGSGIDETDIYARAVSRGLNVDRRVESDDSTVPRERIREIAASRMRRALFATTVDAAMCDRGIAYDDAARDFLDNEELKRVLAAVVENTGRRIDIVGFDACLMNLVEVAYELRESVDHIVASEEVEPGDGWPYDAALGALVASADAAPRDVAANLVQAYVDSYGGNESLTQSALDVARVTETANAVDALAGACMTALGTAEGYTTFTKAMRGAQRFHTKDFADLGDVCTRLGDDSAPDELKSAAGAVLESLHGSSPFIIKAGKNGPGVERATGTAVYFPVVGDVQVAYDRLAFARDTRWDELIAQYNAV